MAAKISFMQGLRTAASILRSRADIASLAGKTFDSNRDLYKRLGYKRALSFSDFEERYNRGGIASRIIEAAPKATWRNPPKVKESGTSDDTPFTEAWRRLVNEKQLLHFLERVDTVAGIGTYGVMLFGLQDGQSLDTAASRVNGVDDLLYLSIFMEKDADIKTLESNERNRRFGKPTEYKLQLTQDNGLVHTDPQAIVGKETHFSRVLHVAEGLTNNDVFGVPRLQRVWNYLDDLDKIAGGTAEAIWRVIDRGLVVNLDPEATLDQEDEEDFEEEIEEYVHDIKRYLRVQGAEVKSLGADAPDPTGAFMVTMQLISGTTGIPLRILLGSERGQLASSQDERNFNARIRERQITYAEPVILRPTIDMLVRLGVLPAPETGYTVDWPDLSTLTARERSDVAARMAQAVANVSRQAKNGQTVYDPDEFRRDFMLSEEAAREDRERGEHGAEDEGSADLPENVAPLRGSS